jgi:hypothetical protein
MSNIQIPIIDTHYSPRPQDAILASHYIEYLNRGWHIDHTQKKREVLLRQNNTKEVQDQLEVLNKQVPYKTVSYVVACIMFWEDYGCKTQLENLYCHKADQDQDLIYVENCIMFWEDYVNKKDAKDAQDELDIQEDINAEERYDLEFFLDCYNSFELEVEDYDSFRKSTRGPTNTQSDVEMHHTKNGKRKSALRSASRRRIF